MKRHYEGSIAELDSEDYGEPCDVFAATEEIAALKIIEAFLKADELEPNKEVKVCVREITVDGDPVGEWHYYRGEGYRTFHSEVREIPIANTKG